MNDIDQQIDALISSAIAAWNASADEYNQWIELSEDEKFEWLVSFAFKAGRDSVVQSSD